MALTQHRAIEIVAKNRFAATACLMAGIPVR